MAAIDPQLQQLFDEIATAGDVDKLAVDKRPEGLYLEFKTKEDATTGAPSDPDKNGFAEQLSAFANADGGVMIFGIKTTKKDGPEYAACTKPIKKHRDFARRLQSSVLDRTIPPVDGVQFVPIDVTPGEGYVKILVPPSNRPPHMEAKEKIYYRRSSDNNRRMDHFEIADMLGGRQRPELKIQFTLRDYGTGSDRKILKIALINEGRTSAKFAGFTIVGNEPLQGPVEVFSPLMNQSAGNPGGWCFVYDNSIGAIHPNGIYAACGEAHFRRADPAIPLEARFILYADGMQTRNEAIEMSDGVAQF